MLAMTSSEPDRLGLEFHPDPVPRDGELLIDIRATAVNRADLLQRRGLYPPPPGESPVLGLECAGVVATSHDSRFRQGDRVMALLAGGGYATRCVVDAGSALPIPQSWSFETAAAFPEVFATAYLNLVMLGGATSGSTVLVHGGSGGVGTAAIQICRVVGARCVVTAGGADRRRRCVDLGADDAFDHRSDDWPERVSAWTGKPGLEVILDCIGGRYLAIHQRLLARDGRLVVIGLMGGRTAELDLARLLTGRQQIIGSTLRSRSTADKADIMASLEEALDPAVAAGDLEPVVDRVLPLEQAAEAHRLLEDGAVFGKLVLRVDPSCP
jgi:putative PIG3 family NAD(P)H quinone oxidoreductase